MYLVCYKVVSVSTVQLNVGMSEDQQCCTHLFRLCKDTKLRANSTLTELSGGRVAGWCAPE